MATQGGLARFDGENWVVYDTENSGLPSNWIWRVVTDAQGDPWVGTRDGGLAVIRGSEGDPTGAGQ